MESRERERGRERDRESRERERRGGKGKGRGEGAEVFTRNSTDGSLAVLACQLATFAQDLNEVFLSY